MIKITLNGQQRDFPEHISLIGVLESLGVSDASHIAVAHNGEVMRREDLGDIELSDGDRIEVVRAVGGG